MSLPLPPGQTARRWQLEAMDATRQALATHQAVIVSAATGTGKGSVVAGLASYCPISSSACVVSLVRLLSGW